MPEGVPTLVLQLSPARHTPRTSLRTDIHQRCRTPQNDFGEKCCNLAPIAECKEAMEKALKAHLNHHTQYQKMERKNRAKCRKRPLLWTSPTAAKKLLSDPDLKILDYCSEEIQSLLKDVQKKPEVLTKTKELVNEYKAEPEGGRTRGAKQCIEGLPLFVNLPLPDYCSQKIESLTKIAYKKNRGLTKAKPKSFVRQYKKELQGCRNPAAEQSPSGSDEDSDDDEDEDGGDGDVEMEGAGGEGGQDEEESGEDMPAGEIGAGRIIDDDEFGGFEGFE
ncbi:MAG: hypothetical protein Q9183_003420 [Haloplaca sp. 2 TL-2023]